MTKLPLQLSSMDGVELPARPLHLAIGMFDGVHLGHRAVIESAVQSARGNDGLSGVMTFWPHPSAVLRPQQATRLIQGAAVKAQMLVRLGVDLVITQTFGPEMAMIAAENFLPWLKSRLPRLAAIYVGENFRFGQSRKGDVNLLVEAGRREGVRVFSAPRVSLDGEPISSTRIRELLSQGEVAKANARLGYHYFAVGQVAEGKRLGRTLGFPTLNVAFTPDLAPRFGVYAMTVSREDGSLALPAVANYGIRPTVENTHVPRIEAHVLGDCPFGAGDFIRAEWLSFLRPEMKFSGMDALQKQIAVDRDAAHRFFEG